MLLLNQRAVPVKPLETHPYCYENGKGGVHILWPHPFCLLYLPATFSKDMKQKPSEEVKIITHCEDLGAFALVHCNRPQLSPAPPLH